MINCAKYGKNPSRTVDFFFKVNAEKFQKFAKNLNFQILKKKKHATRRQSQSYKFEKFAKIFEFWNGHYTRHTFWSCLIRCENMKWIRRVLLKIQSGHDSVHRRTDGQGDTSIPPFQLRWSGGYNKEFNVLHHSFLSSDNHRLTIIPCHLYESELLMRPILKSSDRSETMPSHWHGTDCTSREYKVTVRE